MSRDSAKAHYTKQPGDPDEGFITASDAQAAIDDIYDDMSAPAVIADGSVTSGKIAADAVGSAQIATGAVGSGELATDAVTSDKIADGAVSNAHVASDAAIAASKVAGTALTQASTGGFSVLDFGAVGDGTTDDTAELQAAITAAVAVGGTVLIPPGTYKISDALTVDGPVTITGTGTIHQTATDAYGLTITASDVTVEGITLTGRHATSSLGSDERGISAVGAYDANLTNIQIRNVTATLWGSWGIYLQHVTKFWVTDCDVSSIGYGGICMLSCHEGFVSGNRVDTISPGSTNAYGIIMSRDTTDSLTTDPRSSDIVVSGNTVSNVPLWEGIDTHGGERLTIANNIVLGCLQGISVGPAKDLSTHTELWAPLNVRVVGNFVDSLDDDGLQSAGILFVGAAGATVSDAATEYATGCIVGNTIRRYGRADDATGYSSATPLRNTKGLVISGNTYEESGANSIGAYYDNRNFAITGNTFTDTWTTINDPSVAAITALSVNNTGVIEGNTLAVGDKTTGVAYKNGSGFRDYEGGGANRNLVTLGVNDFALASYAPTYNATGAVHQIGLTGTKVGFFGSTGATKPAITGSRMSNAAVTSLLAQLAALGLITDTSTGINNNLLSANAASIETDNSGWALDGATSAVRSTDQSVHGDASLLSTSPTDNLYGVALPYPAGMIPVIAGVTYTVVASVLTATGTRTQRVNVDWYTSGDSFISQSYAVVANPTSWTQIVVTAVAPPTAAKARIVLCPNQSGSAGDSAYWDCIGIWEGTDTTWAMPGTPADGTVTRADPSDSSKVQVFNPGNGSWVTV